MANALPEGSVNLICQRDHLCSGKRTELSPAVVRDSHLQRCCMNNYHNPAEMSFILQMLPFASWAHKQLYQAPTSPWTKDILLTNLKFNWLKILESCILQVLIHIYYVYGEILLMTNLFPITLSKMCLYIPLITSYFCEFHLHRSILSHMAKHPE